jgi:hypothetical protein
MLCSKSHHNSICKAWSLYISFFSSKFTAVICLDDDKKASDAHDKVGISKDHNNKNRIAFLYQQIKVSAEIAAGAVGVAAIVLAFTGPGAIFAPIVLPSVYIAVFALCALPALIAVMGDMAIDVYNCFFSCEEADKTTFCVDLITYLQNQLASCVSS